MLKVGSDKNISDKVAFQALVAVSLSWIFDRDHGSPCDVENQSSQNGGLSPMFISCLSDEIIVTFLNVLYGPGQKATRIGTMS